MKRIILAAMVGVLVSGPAWSKDVDPLSGNFWLKTCTSTVEKVMEHCLGFVYGLSEGLMVFEGTYIKVGDSYEKVSSYCMPDGLNLGQLKDILVKFLRDHPEKRHERVSVLFSEATRKAF
jgi:hypothetical protein